MWHGICDSTDGLLMNSPEKAPGFVVAREGYDVWFPNSRGNKYSMGHTHLSNSDSKYWDFSFEDIALKDTPAVVSYILALTN